VQSSDPFAPILRLVNLATGTLVEIVSSSVNPPFNTPDSTYSLVTSRSRDEGGFWLAMAQSSRSSELDLWQVDASGTATRKGTYPSLPDGGAVVTGILDGCLTFFSLYYGTARSEKAETGPFHDAEKGSSDAIQAAAAAASPGPRSP
jgi:hypothetical protein